MGAALPEVAEVAGFGVADFAVLFSILGLIVLRFAWAQTFGRIFETLAHLLDFEISVGPVSLGKPLGAVADFLRKIDHYVMRAIGEGIAAQERTWHRFLLWQAYILTATADEMAALSGDVWHAVRGVYAHVAPAKVIEIVRPTVTHTATTIVKTVVPRPVAVKIAADAYPALAARVATLERELAHTVTGAIAIPVPHLPGLERDVGAIGKKVRGLGWLGAFGGLLALGGALLTRLHLGWLKCANVNTLGKRVCRMDTRLLDALLAGATVIVGTVSLVEFAKLMLSVEEEMTRALQGGIRELRGVKPLTFSGYSGTLG